MSTDATAKAQEAAVKSLLDVPESQRRPMTDIEADILLAALITDRAKMSSFATLSAETVAKSFMLSIIASRLKLHGGDASVGAVAFVASLCDRPGIAVMWAHTLHVLHRLLGKMVTVEDVVEKFPMGLPKEEGYAAIWDSQKCARAPDNLLDYPEAWA